MAKWLLNFVPESVIVELEKSKKMNGQGGVTFEGWEHEECIALLRGMISFDETIPEHEQRKIVNAAAFKAGAKGGITKETFLNSVTSMERDFLRDEKTRYKLVTSISISRFVLLPRVHFGGSRIIVGAKLSPLLNKSRTSLIESARHSLTAKMPTDYSDVSVSTSARSPAEAAKIALDALDFVRGIWNLWRNRRTSLRMSSGARMPVNFFVLGPIHTTHDMKGNRASSSWWYEPTYRGAIRVWDEKKATVKMLEFYSEFMGLLLRSPYSSDIVISMIRYSRALDETDWNSSFLQLWGLLEFLTSTQHNENHKVTVQRGSFMFKNRDYHKQVLSNLREYRNRYVHAASDSDDIETLMYLLKRYVEAMIIFHIGSKLKFKSIGEASELLDLPSEKMVIEKKLRLLLHARKLMI